MFISSFLQRLGMAVALLWVMVAQPAFSQTEPTLSQVYAAAHSGQFDKAQTMMQQVLEAHPKSAKAHYVQAELWAQQGKLDKAAQALGQADKLAPGLPFAKPEAVQGLRSQIADTRKLASKTPPAPATPAQNAGITPSAPVASWGLPLLLAAAVIALGYFVFRRKPALSYPAPTTSYAGNPNAGGGLSGPQTFGANPGGMPAAYAPTAPTAAPGLGSRIAGGVATGLAVGAGMMAAEAIGKTLMGGHESSRGAAASASPSAGGENFEAISQNYDMGGQDFGVNDASSWDDSSGASGGDWDS